MASVASLEKIEIIRSQEFMPSEARLKFLKKKIILGPKTAILGPQFCRILVLGPHFWYSGGGRAPWNGITIKVNELRILSKKMSYNTVLSHKMTKSYNAVKMKILNLFIYHRGMTQYLHDHYRMLQL